jgi:two-component system KDP operon response regulator KdpE
MAGQVLLVEDDRSLRQTLTKALELGGYHVVQAESIAEGTLRFSEMINRSDSERLDLMIVDLGLPDGDGGSLIRWVRAQSSVPLIIISARYDDNSKVNLLDAGADDYLVKPFSFTEMMARIRVAMRHRHFEENPAPKVYRASGIEIDLQRHQVIRHGERVRLTPTEFKLLERLMLQSGQVVTHRQLLADVWGAEFVEHTHYLRLYMAQLRNKLEEVPAQPKLLITEPGIGYRLSEAEPN